jgi:uncharacterized protein YbjT (DUF2867 family)
MSLKTKRYIITGSTTEIGKSIVEQLKAAGHSVIEISRAKGISIDDEDKLHSAFKNADGAYLMMPFDMEATDLHSREKEIAEKLSRAVEINKIPRVVCLSGANAHLKFGTSLGAALLEDRLNILNIPELVHLRCGFFMENFIKGMSFFQQAETGSFSTPFRPDRKTPMIATKDIAQVAATIMLGQTFHEPRERELLGAKDYSMKEATQILGSAIGMSDLTYHQASYEDALSGMIAAGLSPSFTAAVIETAKSFNKGELWALETRSLTNTTSTTLEIFAEEVLKGSDQLQNK